MLRQIIKPTTEHYDLHIPKEYLNHEVEILVLPFFYPLDSEPKIIKKEKKSLLGTLSKYANPSLIENEKDIAWRKLAKDKNDLS